MTVNDKIRNYEPMIHSIILKLNILYEQDEYMQIGRLAVMESINKFDSSKASCSESQFVYTLIRQRLIDEIRKVSRYQDRYTPVDHQDVDIASSHDHYQFEDLAEKLLDTREYQWLRLTLSGYSLTEIAKRLSVSVSTAKNIRKSARNKLKERF